MKYRDLWKLSLLNVFASPMRSMLTVLGMAIGVGAILAVLTLGDAGRTQVQSEMGRLGIDKVWLSAAEPAALQHGDAGFLAEQLGLQATEQIYLAADVRVGSRNANMMVIGCSEDYLNMVGGETSQGRMLYPLEWLRGSRSALMGTAAAEQLCAAPDDVIRINGIPFVIRGIVEASGAFSRVDIAEAVILPTEILHSLTGQTVHEILLDVPDGQLPQNVAAAAQSALENERGTAVEALTMQVQIEAANSVIATFVEVLKWVALICILVGGIGVMNILLVSVRERRREIGVMKSLGTSEGQISALFLLEALLYAVIGGILGVLVGAALINAAGKSIGLHPVLRLADCVMVVLIALAVGLFFGVTPASRAARLHPVDALHQD